jgi:homoserine kinase
MRFNHESLAADNQAFTANNGQKVWQQKNKNSQQSVFLLIKTIPHDRGLGMAGSNVHEGEYLNFCAIMAWCLDVQLVLGYVYPSRCY